MPWYRKTLSGLTTAFEADLDVELGEDVRFPAADRVVLARVVAGGLHGLHGHLAGIANQVLPDSADEDYLLRHAAWWGVRRKEATPAEGWIAFRGQPDALVPLGTAVQRDDGTEYITVEEIALNLDGTGTAAAIALVVGIGGNCAEGTGLRLSVTLAGIRGDAVVASPGFVLGTDQEAVEELRDRLRARVQTPPLGGAVHDYRNWALEVPGVTRAWAWPNWVGRGTVGVAIVADRQEQTIIPTPALVAKVQSYLEDWDRCAPGCAPRVFAPTPKPLLCTIGGLSPATPAVRRAVEKSLADLLAREAEPGKAMPISHVREAISVAAGEYDHVLISPVENITCARGEMLVHAPVEWAE